MNNNRIPFLIASVIASQFAAADIADVFKTPPHEARPHTWYHMMNGNVTKSGITKDFEALARIGMGGVQMFDAGCGVPEGTMAFNSPEWMDMMKHAALESKRLGLEIALPNCSGWSSSGGPWITPEKGMKMSVHSETRVVGPGKKTIKLPAADLGNGFYDDVAVIAFPTPKIELQPLPPMKAEYAFTGDPIKRVFTFTADSPFVASGFQFRYDVEQVWANAPGDARAEASADGKTWYDVRWEKDIALTSEGMRDDGIRVIGFPRPVKAVAFRFSFGCPEWVKCNGIFDVKPLAGLRVSELRQRTSAFATVRQTSDENSDPGSVVDPKFVRRLKLAFAADGTAEWDAPAGDWTVVRVGYSATGKHNHPASKTGEGLEVDKLDGEAVAWHFEQYVGKLCRHLGKDLYGQKDYGLKGVLVDSYEVGPQNWTKRLPEEFAKRRGYPIDDYLAVMAGFVVRSAEDTNRFLTDFRLTVSELFAENYGGALQKKCHEYGLQLSLEPYGNAPMDAMSYGRFADIPMGEFWASGQDRSANCGNGRYVAQIGHVWGRPVIATESFTSHPSTGSRWQTTPYSIKHQGDLAFAAGVNRIIYHRFTHQPYTDDRYKPGFTMGIWGMHFDRTQTWWELAEPWISYQSRCQALLQAGSFVGDALVFVGDAIPNKCEPPYQMPKGYGYDLVNRDVLPRLTVDKGELVAPSGLRYPVMFLDPKTLADPQMIAAVAKLEKAGARIVRDGKLEEAFAKLGLKPDCLVDFKGGDWIHRTDAANDWYFIATPNDEAVDVVCSFRVKAKTAELWDAETGVRHELAVEERDGRAVVTLPMRPNGSAFVVFPKNGEKRAGLAKAMRIADVAKAEPVKGPFELEFPGQKSVALEKLLDWTAFDDADKRYFSGTATYRFEVPRAGTIDLGDVKYFAEVFDASGKRLAVLWRPPFRCEVPAGKLVVKVTNLWPNRLIGDEFKPDDCEWVKDSDGGYAIKEIPAWVKEGKDSPTGRSTFTTWKHWTKDDKPLASGMLGPVRML